MKNHQNQISREEKTGIKNILGAIKFGRNFMWRVFIENFIRTFKGQTKAMKNILENLSNSKSTAKIYQHLNNTNAFSFKKTQILASTCFCTSHFCFCLEWMKILHKTPRKILLAFWIFAFVCIFCFFGLPPSALEGGVIKGEVREILIFPIEGEIIKS